MCFYTVTVSGSGSSVVTSLSQSLSGSCTVTSASPQPESVGPFPPPLPVPTGVNNSAILSVTSSSGLRSTITSTSSATNPLFSSTAGAPTQVVGITTTAPLPSSTSNNNGNTSSSVGPVVGGVLAGIAGLSVFTALFLYRRRAQRGGPQRAIIHTRDIEKGQAGDSEGEPPSVVGNTVSSVPDVSPIPSFQQQSVEPLQEKASSQAQQRPPTQRGPVQQGLSAFTAITNTLALPLPTAITFSRSGASSVQSKPISRPHSKSSSRPQSKSGSRPQSRSGSRPQSQPHSRSPSKARLPANNEHEVPATEQLQSGPSLSDADGRKPLKSSDKSKHINGSASRNIADVDDGTHGADGYECGGRPGAYIGSLLSYLWRVTPPIPLAPALPKPSDATDGAAAQATARVTGADPAASHRPTSGSSVWAI